MKFTFDCKCGSEISDFTRDGGDEASAITECQDCGEGYAVTVSPLKLS